MSLVEPKHIFFGLLLRFEEIILYCFSGIYVCKKCNHELFSAKAKFKHETPWPAFQDTIRADSLVKEIETVPQTSSKAKCFKVCWLGSGMFFSGYYM